MARHLLMPGLNHYIHRVLDVGSSAIETILDGNTYFQDATIFNGTPDTNEGLTTTINFLEGGAKARAVTRVSLDSIPTNAIIQSAKFTYYVNNTQAGAVLAWYRVLVGDWIETQVTWNSTRTGELWFTAGAGRGQADAWRSGELSATLPASTGPGLEVPFNALGLQSLQEMVRGNLYQNGWRIHSNNASFHSLRSPSQQVSLGAWS